MRTVVFNQGFNRVEHRQIITLERAKLNRQLDEERRFTETLIASAKREIEAGARGLPSFEIVWNKIQNHTVLQNVRRRIDCLTDAYPQFLQQVNAVRASLCEKAFAALEAARTAIQKANCEPTRDTSRRSRDKLKLMKKIVYTVGDATKPEGVGRKIIAHVCNDTGAWGRGFVLAISTLSPAPERAFREWYRGRERNDFALGAVQFVSVSPDIEVANMIGQHGIRKSEGVPPIRYTAVETALKTVGEKAQAENASVHLPRIGSGLAGGKWSQIEPLIERQICALDVPVFVYDLP